MKEFKGLIYPQYIKLFPKSERKSYKEIEDSVNKGITNIIAIIENKEIIGFMMLNIVINNPYAQLDYFAIFQIHQGKGYGTKAIKLLQEMYKDYNGIFIEIEKLGLGGEVKENQIREKRAKFYERLGFSKLNFDLELFKVVYSAYILPCSMREFCDENVIEKIFEIYCEILGETRIKNNCKVVRNLRFEELTKNNIKIAARIIQGKSI